MHGVPAPPPCSPAVVMRSVPLVDSSPELKPPCFWTIACPVADPSCRPKRKLLLQVNGTKRADERGRCEGTRQGTRRNAQNERMRSPVGVTRGPGFERRLPPFSLLHDAPQPARLPEARLRLAAQPDRRSRCERGRAYVGAARSGSLLALPPYAGDGLL